MLYLLGIVLNNYFMKNISQIKNFFIFISLQRVYKVLHIFLYDLLFNNAQTKYIYIYIISLINGIMTLIRKFKFVTNLYSI